MRCYKPTLRAVLVAAVLVTTAAACLPTGFSSKGRAPATKDDSKPRPTEGDESLPGYFLDVSAVQVSGDPETRRLRITAPAGAFAAGRAPRVGILRVAPEALQRSPFYPADSAIGASYVVLYAEELASVAPAADGSFRAEATFDGRPGDLLMVATETQGGKVIVRRSSRATTAVREPFGSGALRVLSFDDVAGEPAGGGGDSAMPQADPKPDSGVTGGGEVYPEKPLGDDAKEGTGEETGDELGDG